LPTPARDRNHIAPDATLVTSGTVFTSAERVRDGLVSAAKADARIIGAALAGLSAQGREDRWSDIDLALCLDADGDHTEVVADWTERLYADHGAVTHLDAGHQSTLFRVFLLAGTLQVDISFWAADDFGATGPRWRVDVRDEPVASTSLARHRRGASRKERP
jgi:hypothetical protein